MTATSWDSSTSLNPYFLSAGIQFTSQLSPDVSDPTFYVYGGMCPYTNTNSSSSWEQSSASYSSRMLRVSSSGQMTLDLASSAGGPPVAEAGFTFTALPPPSIANRSGIVTQQMSYVMLGGHTQSAFVNMSTAAVWSLPEETWTFVAIQDPLPTRSSSGNPDLAVKKAVTRVDSRSGHTAVLSEDGTSLVILGGWVGDVTQPAEPLVAVVHIGASFEEWQWTIPAGIDGVEGIYGHGAALLPGNVMMVYGGYDIISTTSKKAKRQEGGQQGVRFFNITSMAWQDEYINPTFASGGPSASSPPPTSDTTNPKSPEETNKKLGLGLGLGIGILLLIALIVAAIFFRRRQQRRRQQRDEALRGLSQGIHPHRNSDDDDEMFEQRNDDDPNSGIGFFPWNASTAQHWYTGGGDPYSQGIISHNTASNHGRRSLGYETLRGSGSGKSGSSGGLCVPPLPPAPLMMMGGSSNGGSSRPRGSVARGLVYQPTTGNNSYDFAPLRTPNRIHPIYEDDENDEDEDGAKHHPLSPERDDIDDPFLTPTREVTALFPPPAPSSGSNSPSRETPSPEMVQLPTQKPQQQDPEVQGWVSDGVDAADAVLTARISRHGSTTTTPDALLTAQQQGQREPTTPSRKSTGGGRGSPSRRASTRSAKKSVATGDDDRTGSNLSDRSVAFSFVQSGGGVDRSASVRSHLRFNNNNGGGDGRPGTSSGSSSNTFSTAKSNFATMQAEGPSLLLGGTPAMAEHDEIDEPGSPSKSKPRRSWFGSLRRVFSGATPSPGSSTRGGGADSPTRDSLLEGNCSDYEPTRLVGMGPNGTLLQRRKQGREAWERGGTGPGPDEHDDEWDVEKAVEQRLVQIMFTVPKERLRVVNAEIEKEEEAVVVVDPENDLDGYLDDLEGEQEEEEYRRARQKQVDEKGKDKEGERVIEVEAGGKEQDTLSPQDGNGAGGGGAGGGISPSTSMRSSTVIETAEAVRMERPRTRVREMVETIESINSSRDNSPSGSPVR
ncbi:hypothetical protein B0H66DRAFT_559330 [Apodospora peruviana]|uniref:Galactose oxidase n=1 Tax=Apodospora peruviana TaxID=516989 RepID=A0AAE0M4R3_9PEZI|nr:hypothetical protein B0H66DRAFT_559330 [Apodospora peruviana]